jgi:hypothetical protein
MKTTLKYPTVIIKKVSELSPAKYNPRKISDEALGRLTKSLAEFGNLQPITWNVQTGNVVGGHQRLKVYQAMGKEEVEVWAVDLSEQKEKAANIALNKLSGEFDMVMFKDLIGEIDTGDIDLDITGFSQSELEQIMLYFKEPTDVNAEWDGMPEFSQEDKTAFRRLIVNFNNQEDFDKFCKAIGQKLTDATKSIYYPKLANEPCMDKVYADT